MRKFKPCLLWVAVILATPPVRPAVKPPELPKTVLVGLADKKQAIVIDSESPFIVRGSLQNPIDMKTRQVSIEWQRGHLISNGKSCPDELIVQSESSRTLLRYQGRSYRGTLRIRNRGSKKIQVINEVGLDDYLAGVLPFEASPHWAPEALKAQAVVSRSFVASSLWRHGADGYDVCPLTHCQVYRGAAQEDPRTSKAVLETHGEVLAYQGNLITAYFHADCGGRTESAADVWEKAPRVPYLTSVRCKKGKSWKALITREDLVQAFRVPGMTASEIRSLRISSRTSSGRARTIAVSTRHHGTVALSANALRLRLGPDTVRSTYWDHLRKIPAGWQVSGIGWGHGVGLCQWGAESYGEKGWNYRRILNHYYRGTRVEHRA